MGSRACMSQSRPERRSRVDLASEGASTRDGTYGGGPRDCACCWATPQQEKKAQVARRSCRMTRSQNTAGAAPPSVRRIGMGTQYTGTNQLLLHLKHRDGLRSRAKASPPTRTTPPPPYRRLLLSSGSCSSSSLAWMYFWTWMTSSTSERWSGEALPALLFWYPTPSFWKIRV